MALMGCAASYPLMPNEVLTYTQSAGPISSTSPDYSHTLQVRWLGTASYFLQLGDAAILTDPFYTHASPLQVVFGTISSAPELVREKTSRLPKPRAIFVGHSHYDHMLDLAETLRQNDWFDVPTYGSETTRNILHGYGPDLAEYCHDRFRIPITDGALHSIDAAGGLAYRAYLSEHAPQFGSILLYPGAVTRPRTAPPTRAADFLVGDTYTLLFELAVPGSDPPISHTVYFAGSASSPRHGLPQNPIAPVDVAILTVPGWRNVNDYPREFVQRLRPRSIVPAHYNDFFDESPDSRRVVPTADLTAFLGVLREASGYPEFRRIVLPDVDAWMSFND